MLGNAKGRPGNKANDSQRELHIPDELRQRLAGWIDIEAVGAEGFWRWFGTVLPLLGGPRNGAADSPSRVEAPAERVRALARELVDCAGERARLTVKCDEYYRDNQMLARRVKALESVLRTTRAVGHSAPVAEDGPATEAAERYLPRKGG